MEVITKCPFKFEERETAVFELKVGVEPTTCGLRLRACCPNQIPQQTARQFSERLILNQCTDTPGFEPCVHGAVPAETISRSPVGKTAPAVFIGIPGGPDGRRYQPYKMNSATADFGAGPNANRAPLRPSSTTALSSAFIPRPGRPTSLATIQSRFFSASFRRARFSTSRVSAAKPTTTCPGLVLADRDDNAAEPGRQHPHQEDRARRARPSPHTRCRWGRAHRPDRPGVDRGDGWHAVEAAELCVADVVDVAGGGVHHIEQDDRYRQRDDPDIGVAIRP